MHYDFPGLNTSTLLLDVSVAASHPFQDRRGVLLRAVFPGEVTAVE